MARMRRLLRALAGRRGWAVLGMTLLAVAVSTAVLALSLFPFVQSQYDRAAAEQSQPSWTAPTLTAEKPNFVIAVGIEDEHWEVPAIQSAKTEWLNFSEEFATRLEQGAVAPNFSTHERTMSRQAAVDNVESGAAVLAVVLPEDLSKHVVDDTIAAGRGELTDPQPYEFEIVTSPQARADNGFIANEYRDQVIRQAVEHVSHQIHVVAEKMGCGGSDPCPHAADVGPMFENPIELVQTDVNGPPAVDYLYPTVPGDTGTPQSPDEAAAAIDRGEETRDGAGPGADSDDESSGSSHPRHQEQLGVAAYLDMMMPTLLAAAGIAIGLTAVAGVNAATGRRVFGLTAWQSAGERWDFSRRGTFTLKLGLSLVASTLTGLAALIFMATVIGQYDVEPSLHALAPPVLYLVLAVFLPLACAAVIVTSGELIGPGAAIGVAFGLAGIGAITLGTVDAITGSALAGPIPDAFANASFSPGSLRILASSGTDALIQLGLVLAVTVLLGFSGTRMFDRRSTETPTA